MACMTHLKQIFVTTINTNKYIGYKNSKIAAKITADLIKRLLTVLFNFHNIFISNTYTKNNNDFLK